MNAADSGGDLQPAAEGQRDASLNAPAPSRSSSIPHLVNQSVESDKRAVALTETRPMIPVHLPTEFVDAFSSLTSVSRPLLVRMNGQFLKDPVFRDYVRHYLDPPDFASDPSETFRFMDLPTELRIRIAEYALHDEYAIVWDWKTFKSEDPKQCQGGFRLIFPVDEPINPLGATCNQLRKETKDIVYKVNNLRFDSSEMRPRRCDMNDDVKVMFAYRYFLTFADSHVLAACRRVELVLDLDWLKANPSALHEIHLATQKYPKIEHTIRNVGWFLDASESTIASTQEFISEGREHQIYLRTLLPSPTWRLYPTICGEIEEVSIFKKDLAVEDYQAMFDWAKDGI